MTPLASSSLVQMSYIEETVFGETPTVGTPKNLRMTGESLTYDITKTSSDEINKYRATTSMIPTEGEASGGINFELSYAEYDPLMEAVLQGTWLPAESVAPFEATFTANTLASDVPVPAFLTLKKGQWFNIGNSGVANSPLMFRVSKTVAPTDQLVTLDPGTPATPGVFVGATLNTSRVSNGTKLRTYSLQRHLTDVEEYFSYRGMAVASMSLSMASGAITTGEFTFMGRDSEQSNIKLLPNVADESQAFQVMSGVTGTLCALWVGGEPLAGTYIEKIDLSYDNSLRSQKAYCSKGSIGIGNGTIVATVNISVYFTNGATFYSEMLDNSNLEIAFTAFDSEGNGYVFTFPAMNVSSYSIAAGSKDSDMLADITLTALLDLKNPDIDLRKVMFIDRFGSV